MLDILAKLYKFVEKHKDYNSYDSVFKEISDVYFYENYHSDIIAYYLRNSFVKKIFIKWLNTCINNDTKNINFDEYNNGEVKREKNRIDITIFSNDNRKAIIIENKSNNARDQFNQVYIYYKKLLRQKINVEAIFYLNKDSIKPPDLSSLNEKQRKNINDILVKSKLVGENSFVDKVINIVIDNIKDIRLNGLSQELRDLLYYIVYGAINMEKMEEFVSALMVDDNLLQLKKVIEAYNDIPEYLMNKYLEYINKKQTGFNVWPANDNRTIAIDVIKNKVNYYIDINPSCDEIEFIIAMRSGSSKHLIELKEKSGSNWIFDDEYSYVLKNPLFNEKKIKKIIDKIIKCLYLI